MFDSGSGVCLWSTNEAAREELGYAIDHWALPLSENTKRWLQHLVAWYDTSLDWESPANSDQQWTSEELKRFNAAAKRGLEMLCRELPDLKYSVSYEERA
ncbi:hypothetical protein [Variovorax rhizosphaerae]|uniref:Uncharacterized protein n=1 Tax=Variovorax rhizosphaerae TaxID=1836200 RepID=A0ABU8WSN0_9BURK